MIEPYLTQRTKMVLINSPSNPSGAVLDRAEFEKIYRLTAERGIFLMTESATAASFTTASRFRSPRSRARKRTCWWPGRFRRLMP